MNITEHDLMVIFRNLMKLQVIAELRGNILTESAKSELDGIVAKVENMLNDRPGNSGTSVEKGMCPYCRLPIGSVDCQRSHP